MKSPCQDCPDRHTACHDHCDNYKAWKADLTEAKRAAQLEKDIYWTKGRKRARASARKMNFKIGGNL